MEAERIVVDARVSPFMMGHTYVALTRVTAYKDIAILNTVEQVLDGSPTIVNVVYPELLTDEDKIVHPPSYDYDMTNHSENIRLQHKLCEARVFNKLKFNTNSPSEQAKRLVASSIPLSKRKEL